MTVAGTERDLQEINVLAELPRLVVAIGELNTNLTRFMSTSEARTTRIEDNSERADVALQAMQDGQQVIESELKLLNTNVARIARAASRVALSEDFPWTPEPPERTPSRRKKPRQADLPMEHPRDERQLQDELAQVFLATLKLADNPRR
jgi:hypothetical protein